MTRLSTHEVLEEHHELLVNAHFMAEDEERYICNSDKFLVNRVYELLLERSLSPTPILLVLFRDHDFA